MTCFSPFDPNDLYLADFPTGPKVIPGSMSHTQPSANSMSLIRNTPT